jgi:N-acetylneuraminic acid mutarotase
MLSSLIVHYNLSAKFTKFVAMKQLFLSFLILIMTFGVFAQGNWEWTKVAPLPIASANNAVSKAIVNNNKFMYSFGGISDSLHSTSIHQRVFKYDISNNSWSEQEGVPDTLGKISSAASFVKNRIYLIGGKYVQANGTEVSSNNVHVYNPFLDTFEVNASPLPVPVHDHVQNVWRDSLIYVISGFSNTSTVPDVQIYNASFDSWTIGNSTPNNPQYKSFGASGYILGDTIYYFGGVTQDPGFQTTNHFRKGVIDADDPSQINWSIIYANPGDPIYRGACSGHNKTLFWIGGSKEAYSYNALGFNTNLPVISNHRVLENNLNYNAYFNYYDSPYYVMDLKGIAKLGGGNWMIAGGIDSLQQASDRTFLLHNTTLSDIENSKQPPFFKVGEANNHYVIITDNVGEIIVYDITGRILYKSNKQLADLYIPKSKLSNGILLFVYQDSVNLPVHIKKIKPQ